MYHIVLRILLFLASAAFILLLFLNIFRRIIISRRGKRAADYRKAIAAKIDPIIDKSDIEFKNGIDKFVKDAMNMEKLYRDTVDDYLMYILEILDLNYRERYITIGWRLDFTHDCMEQIRNANPEISAIGCRRAGLYKIRNAADDMIAALDILSSENQFEILLGLSRMGEADFLQRAFEKIRDSILVNDRAIIQILASFPKGDEKFRLFRNMLGSCTDYIRALFLKSLSSETAAVLIDEIMAALHSGGKEVRAAALRALMVLGRRAPVNELIKAMDDREWEVRCLAAKALGQITNKESALALYKGLHDQQWWVRQNSANSLLNYPGYESLFILAAESGDEYTKDSIIYVLEKAGNPVLLRSIKIMAA
ncbi:MAG: HEAT repeat domain-containing protein [Treponema sp.]|nr:HEAT repeat domain-containing protein [Treponema sp.]